MEKDPPLERSLSLIMNYKVSEWWLLLYHLYKARNSFSIISLCLKQSERLE